MSIYKTIIFVFLLLFPCGLLFAQSDQFEKNALLDYYRYDPAYKDNFDKIEKLVNSADPEQQRKFSQCAQAIIDINTERLELNLNMQSIYETFFTYFDRSRAKALSHIKKLLPSFSYNPFDFFEEKKRYTYDFTESESRTLELYAKFENISAEHSSEDFISTLTKSAYSYKEIADIISNYYILYTEEMNELEKSMLKAGLVPSGNMKGLVISFYKYKLLNFINKEMKKSALDRKYNAENDMVFCDRMMTSLLNKPEESVIITTESSTEQFNGSWYFKDGAGSGYYIWNFSANGTSISGNVECTSTKEKEDNHSLSNITVNSDGSIQGSWSGSYLDKATKKAGQRFGTFKASVSNGVITINVSESEGSAVFGKREWGDASTSHRQPY